MRKTNFEIEFKSAVSEETYNRMLKLFDLEDNVFKQTNYYFDTDNFDLYNQKIVLRIRQKGDRFKVTSKSQSGNAAFESHVILTKEQALKMIDEGFNAKDFFEELDYIVTFKASLDNYRVSTHYEDGLLFFDKSVYHNITDYEIEYEYHDYDQGKRIFEVFLEKQNIELKPTKRKSQRALKTK